ncbi:MAG: internalin motif [Verrucomicrobiota bacterium]
MPRRRWHLGRWFIVLMVAALGWVGWTAYAYRSAISQARALGWEVAHTDPVERIRQNWKSAFEKETWLDGVTNLIIPTSQQFEQHLDIVHRLDPMELHILYAATLRDLSALIPLKRLKGFGVVDATGLTNADVLKNFPALRWVSLSGCTGLTNVDGLKSLPALNLVILPGCTGLTNVDGLKNLPALQEVVLIGCTGLKNVDALKDLPALKQVSLVGCTGLTAESVKALKAALPNATIIDP